MNPVLKGKGVMVSQGFYRKDSDSPKDKCSQTLKPGSPYGAYIHFPWICLLVCQLYIHWIVLWVYDVCMHIFTCEHVWACVRVRPVLISHTLLGMLRQALSREPKAHQKVSLALQLVARTPVFVF